MWTRVMHLKICQKTRILCEWSLNHLKFYSCREYASFTFDATSTAYTYGEKLMKYGNVLYAKCFKIPKDQTDSKTTMFDTSKIPHFGSIAGKARKHMKQQFKNVEAVAFEVVLASDIIQTSDIVPVFWRYKKDAIGEEKWISQSAFTPQADTFLCKIQEQNNFNRNVDVLLSIFNTLQMNSWNFFLKL